jgi:hypothetical protein
MRVISCPPEHVAAVLEVLNDYGLVPGSKLTEVGAVNDELVLGEHYSAMEVSCGWVDEALPQLRDLDGVAYRISEDPKYEWLGVSRSGMIRRVTPTSTDRPVQTTPQASGQPGGQAVMHPEGVGPGPSAYDQATTPGPSARFNRVTGAGLKAGDLLLLSAVAPIITRRILAVEPPDKGQVGLVMEGLSAGAPPWKVALSTVVQVVDESAPEPDEALTFTI